MVEKILAASKDPKKDVKFTIPWAMPLMSLNVRGMSVLHVAAFSCFGDDNSSSQTTALDIHY